MHFLFAPGSAVDPPDPGIASRWGCHWKIGSLDKHRVVYTWGRIRDFQTVNLRFPKDGVTVVLISNDIQNDASDIARHASSLLFGERLLPAATGTASATSPRAFLGTYQRTFRDADRRAAGNPGLLDWVGGRMRLTIRKGYMVFALPGGTPSDVDVQEYFRTTGDGHFAMLGYLPTNPNGFCSTIPTESPPTGWYTWSLRRETLVIRRVSVDHCPDRASALPGTRTRTR